MTPEEQRAMLATYLPVMASSGAFTLRNRLELDDTHQVGLVLLALVDNNALAATTLDPQTSAGMMLRYISKHGIMTSDADTMARAAIAVVAKLLCAHEDRDEAQAREIAKAMLQAAVMERTDDEPDAAG